MSDKPQTTRNKIIGIYHAEQAQIVFLDTPGFHKPKHRLNELMIKITMNTLEGIDAVLYLIEPDKGIGPGDRYIIDLLRQIKTPVILAINKIDLLPQREQLLPVIKTYSQAYNFAEIIPISALESENVDRMVDTLIRYLPEGPQYYPEDMVTDQPERFIVAELIREKVLHSTREEIPYSIAVIVDRMKMREKSDLIDIDATVYVERSSQKGILIGKSGRMLKRVGTLARQDIELILGMKIFLTLWVKVRKNWRMDDYDLRMLGLRES
jgi:GTP-binding protein Era